MFDCFSVICNKTFYKVYTLFSTHTPHHTKSALGSRGRDNDSLNLNVIKVMLFPFNVIHVSFVIVHTLQGHRGMKGFHLSLLIKTDAFLARLNISILIN